MVRTNVVNDEELVGRCMHLFGLTTKRAAIDFALLPDRRRSDQAGATILHTEGLRHDRAAQRLADRAYGLTYAGASSGTPPGGTQIAPVDANASAQGAGAESDRAADTTVSIAASTMSGASRWTKWPESGATTW